MEDEPCPDLDPVLFRDRPGRENINVQITISRKIVFYVQVGMH